MSRCPHCHNFGQLHYTRCVDEYLCETCQMLAVEELEQQEEKENE